MLQVSSNYKNAITIPRTIDVVLTFNNETFDSSNINALNRNFYGSLFKSIMKEIELDTNVNILKNTNINARLGLWIESEASFEYVDLGNYKTIEEATLNKDSNSYKTMAYDKIVEAMIPYELTEQEIQYPCTVRELFVAIFTKLGWDVQQIPTTFVNANSSIQEDVFSNINYTYRSVLDELCTISCLFLVDKGGVPKLIQPQQTNENINENYMKDNSVSLKKYIYFNSLVFSRVGGNDNIYRKDDEDIELNGLHEFKVNDLQILSLNWRDNFIDEMWEYIKNFNYYAFDVDTYGITFLEPVDNFNLSFDNVSYNTVLLNSELAINDGIGERIFDDEIEETTTNYQYASETDKGLIQAYINIEKQNGVINGVVSSQTKMQTDIDTTNKSLDLLNQDYSSFKQTANAFNLSISQRLDEGVEKVKNSLVTVDIEGIKVKYSDENFQTVMTNKTFEVKDGYKELVFIGYDNSIQKTVARIPELETSKLSAGCHRCEKFTRSGENRSGWFYTGGVL